jgi:hypothetical protein
MSYYHGTSVPSASVHVKFPLSSHSNISQDDMIIIILTSTAIGIVLALLPIQALARQSSHTIRGYADGCQDKKSDT